MTTERHRLETLAAAVAEAEPRFDAEQQGIALAVYRRLALGTPASASDVAERAGVSTERVGEFLGSWPGVFRDDHGGVIGFKGLSIEELSPTHRFQVDGTPLFTWCAWDTLFLPGILGATARVESRCPTTGEIVALVVTPVGIIEPSHPEPVVSFLVPNRSPSEDLIHSFCHFVHFFVSPDAGEAWIGSHPGTFLLTLKDAFEVGRLVNALTFPSEFGGQP